MNSILLIAASPSTSSTLNIPTGFWASELVHPWYSFTEAGYHMDIASPNGGPIQMDAWSDPRDPSGYSSHDILSMGFLHTPKCAALLESTRKLDAVDPGAYDGVLVCGGQSPMFTFRGNAALETVLGACWQSGKVVAALCHGVAALIDLRLPGGEYLLAGKTMTGFANVEEDQADRIAGTRVMPWRIEDAARERGANFIHAGAWRPFAVRDGNLITGQQQYSGARTAQLVIEALGA